MGRAARCVSESNPCRGEVAQIDDENAEKREAAERVEQDEALVPAGGTERRAGYHSMTELAQVRPPPKTTIKM